jgi:hypothetical protein
MKLGPLSVAAIIATSFVLSGAQARADIVLPTSLASATGQKFTVGDNTFGILAATPSGTQPPSLSAITVVGETLGGTVRPYGFGLSGSIVVAVSAAGELQTSDLAVTYTVTAPSLDPIIAVNLGGTGSAIGPLSSFSVAETIINNADGHVIGTGTLVGAGSLKITLSEKATSITVTTDILATAGGAAGALANYSAVDQTFTQVVPEPASIAMFGLGLLGIGAVSLRRGRRTV